MFLYHFYRESHRIIWMIVIFGQVKVDFISLNHNYIVQTLLHST